MRKKKTIYLELDLDEALVFFEWSELFMQDRILQFSNPAEPIVINNIATKLARSLKEPFHAEYPHLLATARQDVEAKYREAMSSDSQWLQGENNYCGWLNEFQYQSER